MHAFTRYSSVRCGVPCDNCHAFLALSNAPRIASPFRLVGLSTLARAAQYPTSAIQQPSVRHHSRTSSPLSLSYERKNTKFGAPRQHRQLLIHSEESRCAR